MFQSNKLCKFIIISILIFLISSFSVINVFAHDISLIGNIKENSINHINNNLIVFMDYMYNGSVNCKDLENSDRWCKIQESYISFVNNSEDYDYKMIFYNKNNADTYNFYIIKSNKKIEITKSPGIDIPFTSGNYYILNVEYRFDNDGNFIPWLNSSVNSGSGNISISVDGISSDNIYKVNHNIYYVNSNELFYSHVIDIEDIIFNLGKIVNSFIVCFVSCASLLLINSYFLFFALIFIAILLLKKFFGGEK